MPRQIDLQRLSSTEYRDIKDQLNRIEALLRFGLEASPVALPPTPRDDQARRQMQ